MSTIKLTVNISLNGSKPYTEKECIKTVVDDKNNITTLVDYSMKDHHKMQVGSGKDFDIINFHTNKCKPATQTINMTDEAYEAMTSANEVPWWSNEHDWKHYSKIQRLEKHLQRTAESLNGKVLDYEVYLD